MPAASKGVFEAAGIDYTDLSGMLNPIHSQTNATTNLPLLLDIINGGAFQTDFKTDYLIFYQAESFTESRLSNNNKLCSLPSGIFPPEAERRHNTSGMGSPPTRHWNVTEAPSTTTWLCGPRIRNGFTMEVGELLLYSGFCSPRQGVICKFGTIRNRQQRKTATNLPL